MSPAGLALRAFVLSVLILPTVLALRASAEEGLRSAEATQYAIGVPLARSREEARLQRVRRSSAFHDVVAKRS